MPISGSQQRSLGVIKSRVLQGSCCCFLKAESSHKLALFRVTVAVETPTRSECRARSYTEQPLQTPLRDGSEDICPTSLIVPRAKRLFRTRPSQVESYLPSDRICRSHNDVEQRRFKWNDFEKPRALPPLIQAEITIGNSCTDRQLRCCFLVSSSTDGKSIDGRGFPSGASAMRFPVILTIPLFASEKRVDG